jgi:mRNA interferase MazF
MNRSEVWLINLDPTLGAEIRKTRPAVIVSDDAVGILPLKVIVPITDWKEPYTAIPWMIRLNPDTVNGLTKMSAVDTFQIRSISTQRFVRRLGRLTDDQMRDISGALATVLRLI